MLKFLRDTALWLVLLPIALIHIGVGSNQLVLWANHDKFPVMVNEYEQSQMELRDNMMDPVHCVMTNDTHLNFLADVINLHDRTASVGDMAIELGQWLMPYALGIWCFEIVRRALQVPR